MRLLIIILFLLTLASCNDAIQEEKEHFILLNENKIHVKSSGEGAPIIFAHGGYLDLDMWDPQVKEFSKTYQTIRFSDLGHGKTASSKKPLYGHEIINQLTKEYPSEKYILVGLSWGSMLCVDFALNYPDKVQKLVLVSPGLNGWSYFQDSLALKNYNLRQISIEKSDTLHAAKLFHQNWVIGPRRTENDLDVSFSSESLNMVYKTMRNHWQEDWSNLDTIPARTRLEDIKSPTYIVTGEHDAEDILQIADEYHKRVKNSERIKLDSVAHLLTMENAVRFNAILRTILKD